MGIVSALFGEIISIVAFVLFATGVFKLFQVVTLLGEIKELLGRRSVAEAAPFPSAISTQMADLGSGDDAADYAAKLLRAVNSESHTTDSPVSESR